MEVEVKLKFVELHTQVFISGTNMGLKLDPSKRAGLDIKYMRDVKELHVSYKDEMAIIPVTNVVSMIPGVPKVAAVQISHPMVAGIQSAQVETPFGHVHAGLGAGKKR